VKSGTFGEITTCIRGNAHRETKLAILSNADKATDAGTDTHKCMCIN